MTDHDTPAPLPEPELGTGGAPASPQSDAPIEEPLGGAAGEAGYRWLRSDGRRRLRLLWYAIDAWARGGKEEKIREVNRIEDMVATAYEAGLNSAPSVSSLLGELARVRGALEPFAREADRWSDAAPDDTRLTAVAIGAGAIGTLGDLRRARAALADPSPAVAALLELAEAAEQERQLERSAALRLLEGDEIEEYERRRKRREQAVDRCKEVTDGLG